MEPCVTLPCIPFRDMYDLKASCKLETNGSGMYKEGRWDLDLMNRKGQAIVPAHSTWKPLPKICGSLDRNSDAQRKSCLLACAASANSSILMRCTFGVISQHMQATSHDAHVGSA